MGNYSDQFVGDVSTVAKGDVVTIIARKPNDYVYETAWDLNDASRRFPAWRVVGGVDPGPPFPHFSTRFPPQRIAVAQSGSTIDAFAIGYDHRIYWSRGTPGASTFGWSLWEPLGDSSNTFPFQNLTAVYKGTSRVYVLGVGYDQNIRGTSRASGASTWEPFFRVGNGNDGFVLRDLAAVSRRPEVIDVFARDANGAVITYWSVTPGQWGRRGPYSAGQWGYLVPGANISAVSIHPEQVQFFGLAYGSFGPRIGASEWNPVNDWQPSQWFGFPN